MSYEMEIGIRRKTLAQTTLWVAEKFGPTIQGEGPTAGRRAAFIRLSGCNLACSWCDTPYTWDWMGQNGKRYDRQEERHRESVAELVEWTRSVGVDRVVVTGGEPLKQRDGVAVLLRALSRVVAVEVETNGTKARPPATPRTVQWNISPKLANSGNRPALLDNLDTLTTFTQANACLKFVVRDGQDVVEALDVALHAGFATGRVYLMPEGRTPDELNRHRAVVADLAVKYGTNYSPRLHVDAWGDMRGR